VDLEVQLQVAHHHSHLAVFDKSVSMLTFFYAQFVISICNNLVNVQIFNNELLFLQLLVF
jgi:hypothetical protein